MQQDNYDALRTRAAILPLPGRGLIRLSDEDRVRLLHAMSTNATEHLASGEGTKSLFLNDKGRILAEFSVLCRDEDLLIDTEAATRQLVYEHLDRFIIMDVVELVDWSGAYSLFGIEGPAAGDLLRGLGATLPEVPYAHLAWDDAILAHCTVTGGPGYRLYVPSSSAQSWLERLNAAGIPLVDEAIAEVVRHEYGRPRHGVEYSSRFLVQEAQLLDYVSFSKGCYLGQEIVERVRSRGLVNRLLVRLVAETTTPPAIDTPVLAGDLESGKVVSASYSPALGKVIVWALLRNEHLQAGAGFSVADAPATVAPAGRLA